MMKQKFYVIAALFSISVMGAGCLEVDSTSAKDARVSTAQVVEDTQRKLQEATPPPNLTTSAERQNVVKRLEAWNDENKVGYVYLVSYGKVMAFYPTKGKISSLNSFLTPDEALVYGDGTKCARHYTTDGNYEPCYTVSSPDLDGTYGQNDRGIFFFTTEGAYVEWRGEYMFVDQPLKLTTPPELIREIK